MKYIKNKRMREGKHYLIYGLHRGNIMGYMWTVSPKLNLGNTQYGYVKNITNAWDGEVPIEYFYKNSFIIYELTHDEVLLTMVAECV